MGIVLPRSLGLSAHNCRNDTAGPHGIASPYPRIGATCDPHRGPCSPRRHRTPSCLPDPPTDQSGNRALCLGLLPCPQTVPRAVERASAVLGDRFSVRVSPTL